MDYEDRLKLAKEALDSGSYDKETIEYIFPELAKSEDDRIRKAILSGMKFLSGIQGRETFGGIPIHKCIAWLEKQGETREMMGNQGKISPKWINKAYGWLIERYENQGVILLGDINELKQVLEGEQ